MYNIINIMVQWLSHCLTGLVDTVVVSRYWLQVRRCKVTTPSSYCPRLIAERCVQGSMQSVLLTLITTSRLVTGYHRLNCPVSITTSHLVTGISYHRLNCPAVSTPYLHHHQPLSYRHQLSKYSLPSRPAT